MISSALSFPRISAEIPQKSRFSTCVPQLPDGLDLPLPNAPLDTRPRSTLPLNPSRRP